MNTTKYLNSHTQEHESRWNYVICVHQNFFSSHLQTNIRTHTLARPPAQTHTHTYTHVRTHRARHDTINNFSVPSLIVSGKSATTTKEKLVLKLAVYVKHTKAYYTPTSTTNCTVLMDRTDSCSYALHTNDGFDADNGSRLL